MYVLFELCHDVSRIDGVVLISGRFFSCFDSMPYVFDPV